MFGKGPDSIFEKVDIGDAGTVRRLMSALSYYLSRRVLHPCAPEIVALLDPEKSTADSILYSIQRHRARYPLLLEGVLQFINARNGDDKEALQAAKDLDALAPGEVLTFPGAYYEEYVAAETAFYGNDGVSIKVDPQTELQLLLNRAPGAFGQQIFSSKRDTRALEESLRWPPRPPPEVPMTINQNKCKYCTDERRICTRQEPRCGHCRMRNLECDYPPPGSSPYKEPPPLDEAATVAKSEQEERLHNDETDRTSKETKANIKRKRTPSLTERTKKKRKPMSVAKRMQSSPELKDTSSQKRRRHGKSKSSESLSSFPNTDNLSNPCSDPYDADAEDSDEIHKNKSNHHD